MDCKRVTRLLSAYLDHELSDENRKFIVEHFGKCYNCRQEFAILSKQDEFVAKLVEIEPSSGFRAGLWNRIRQTEIKPVGRSTWLFWVPIPAMSILLAIILLNISTFSFAVSRSDNKTRNQIAYKVIESGFISPSILNPVSILKICKGCKMVLCDCDKNGKMCGNCDGK